MLTPIEIVRLNVQDNEPGFYFLSDYEVQYLLDSVNGNTGKASLKAAQIILFKLAQAGDETVDIFSIKGSKAAESYRLALEMYIKNPSMNPMLDDVSLYVGGVSKSDMQANDCNVDNNIIQAPNKDRRMDFRFPMGWTIV